VIWQINFSLSLSLSLRGSCLFVIAYYCTFICRLSSGLSATVIKVYCIAYTVHAVSARRDVDLLSQASTGCHGNDGSDTA